MALVTSQRTKQDSRQDQLARLQGEVDALREQLRKAQRLATVGTMTAMVAHEFNNILTPIVNYARLARKNPDLVDKALDRMASGGTRAGDICRALLDVTRPASPPQPCRLTQLLRDTLDAMARDPAKDGIDLHIDVPEDFTVTTQAVELQQVLLNLLINARTALLASQGTRRIEISARSDGDSAVLRVADNGPGIAPENLERIFEPFFTTKPSDDDSEGYGLGLAFCREVLRDLGGEITVESATGRGATFILRLP